MLYKYTLRLQLILNENFVKLLYSQNNYFPPTWFTPNLLNKKKKKHFS